MEPGFPLSEIDTTKPHPARLYDYYLGGKDNYAVDKEAARQVLRAAPEVREIARANRAFLQRAVRFLVGEAGIRQIIDVGTEATPKASAPKASAPTSAAPGSGPARTGR
jgi:pyruvate/2-oxoglutarate dehydrogenase complex dihydrolipoamide acyltransferase (E2) component